MKSRWLKPTLKIVNVILMISVVFFAYVYGKSLINKADFSGLNNNWWALALAFVCFLFFYVIMSFHWLKVCRIVDTETKSIQALSFFASQPFKYLPSSIFTFSFRAKYAKQLGMSVKKSTRAQLIENFNILGSGLVVSVTFLAFSQSLMLGLLCLIIFALVVYLFIKFKIEITTPFVKGRRKLYIYKLVPSFLLMFCAWVVSGLSFWLVSDSLNYTINLSLAISANAAAFIISILAIFAPGGLGVRELTLALFAIQNSAIIMWRLLTFVADIIVGVIAIIYILIRRKVIDQRT